MNDAVICLSGGLDSTALAGLLVHEDRLAVALSFDYGQRHRVELLAAANVAAHYGVEHVVMDLRPVLDACAHTSALLGGSDVPEGHYAEATMAATVVPGRNLLMLAAATALAASRGLAEVAIAAHAGDHPVYPDCRPDFLAAADLATALGYGVGVNAPFHWLSKAEIVAEGIRLGAPLHLTWSCYKGGPAQCGRCSTCVERIEAFGLAGVDDPTTYLDTTYAPGVLAEWASR